MKFIKQNSSAVKKMEWIENTTKYRQKLLGFRLCMVVSVWVYVGVCIGVTAWWMLFYKLHET